MTTLPTDYSHQQLVDAIHSNFINYFHDDYKPGDEDYISPEEYREMLMEYSHSQLVDETCTTTPEELAEYMYWHEDN